MPPPARAFTVPTCAASNQDMSVDLGLPRTPLLAKQIGEEVGIRAQINGNITFTIALYNLWQQSETIIDPDIGQDMAGPPSERYGYEVNVTWQIRQWLEFYASYSGNHTRFTKPFDDGTGHLGKFITDAPYADRIGHPVFAKPRPMERRPRIPLSGRLSAILGTVRRLRCGARLSGRRHILRQCAHRHAARSTAGFGQMNLDLHYAISAGLVSFRRHLQPPEHPCCSGRILVCRPAEKRNPELRRWTRRHSPASARTHNGALDHYTAVLGPTPNKTLADQQVIDSLSPISGRLKCGRTCIGFLTNNGRGLSRFCQPMFEVRSGLMTAV